ncbi:MerR family transcriptional regulator [Heyndrickxia oleronia]|uniref:MerR family transcriptional regulator n=1 Tax=Heyndrickxia oleronia TaxID=38875 RepID=UPI001C0EFDD9|nr:MerR family transcriptional regulator [Heyndrickxia oleronia]MBU5213164.1 MerR family transcriptional regulator [Heyndrickxia oleronia]
MEELMTIQAFSERTGISKSALRYYETQHLLSPKRKLENGYRYYSEDQIEVVKFISSLRLVGISIKEIQLYISGDEENRQQMMTRWIQSLKQKQELLNVSLRYLEGQHENEAVYLIERKEEIIVWFGAESEVGQFGTYFRERGKELSKNNIRFKSGYLRYLSGMNSIKAEIGFGLSKAISLSALPEGAQIEHMPPCLCIAQSFNSSISQIKEGYRNLIRFAVDHNWVPTGPVLEWYRGEELNDLDLIMPVTKFKGG